MLQVVCEILPSGIVLEEQSAEHQLDVTNKHAAQDKNDYNPDFILLTCKPYLKGCGWKFSLHSTLLISQRTLAQSQASKAVNTVNCMSTLH